VKSPNRFVSPRARMRGSRGFDGWLARSASADAAGLDMDRES
jgi:hypothetical protein